MSFREMSVHVEKVRAEILAAKQKLTGDAPDKAFPNTEAGSAHWWSAVAQLELAFNSLALALEAERPRKERP